jgi:hypothetical protein
MGENIKNGRRYIILGYFASKLKYLLPFLIFSPITRNRPIGLGTIPTGTRPENPRELTRKMFQNSGFITSHLSIFRNFLRCEVINPEFWNIFPVSSRGFSGRILVGIVPSLIGQGLVL